MKLLFRLLMICCLIGANTYTSNAQSIGGDFNKRGTISGTFSTDSATVARNVADTNTATIPSYRNGVSFEFEALAITGTAQDSSVIECWGTKLYNGTTGFVLLNTINLASLQTRQYFMWEPTSFNPGNQYTGYMFILRSNARTSTYTTRWRAHLLLR